MSDDYNGWDVLPFKCFPVDFQWCSKMWLSIVLLQNHFVLTHILVIFPPILKWNTLIVVNNILLWWFHLFWISQKLYPTDPIKCRAEAGSWVLLIVLMHSQKNHDFLCYEVIVIYSFFIANHGMMQEIFPSLPLK